MGWKALKNQFGIKHIVQARAGQLCLGSGYVSDLARVNVHTGEVTDNPTFTGFLAKHYPSLARAPAAQVLELLNTPDEFEAAIPVYTFQDGEVFEFFCEAPGWPNVTHDGQLMHDNTFYMDRATAEAHAVKAAERSLEYFAQRKDSLLAEIRDLEAMEGTLRANLARLPSISSLSEAPRM